MAETARETADYVDRVYVPGLHVETEAGTMSQYHPAGARSAVIDIIKTAVPAKGWWSIDDFIDNLKQDSADFQRPNSDFDSWYIRDADGN